MGLCRSSYTTVNNRKTNQKSYRKLFSFSLVRLIFGLEQDLAQSINIDMTVLKPLVENVSFSSVNLERRLQQDCKLITFWYFGRDLTPEINTSQINNAVNTPSNNTANTIERSI